MARVYITDYIENQDIESAVLGDELGDGSVSELVEVVLVWHEKIDGEFLDRHPNLKAIIRYGVGFDQIDINLARARGITVCNTPDYGTEEVSDTAVAMILNCTRGISQYNYASKSYYETWQENTNTRLTRSSETTVGIIGAGRIGSSVLNRLQPFGFKRCFHDPYVPPGYEKVLLAKRYEALDDLLRTSDVVSVNCPLTSETQGLVDEQFVKKLKPGASFVNTARGGIISDVDVFYQPLKDGSLSNVCLDVLPTEPPKSSRLIEAWRNGESFLQGRLLINPHTAYFSTHSYQEMRTKAAENALRVLEGKTPISIVS